MQLKRLSGRVALVTGASRGIGRATALRLAAEGAAVAVNYRQRAGAAREVAGEIHQSGGRANVFAADVADRQAVDAMFEQVAGDLGPVDVVVNNAGLLYSGDLLNFREHEFDQMWEVNVKGTVHCAAAAAPGMIERQWGRIINLSSIAAAGTAFEGTTFYAATKGAVLTLTRRLAFELGPHGVTVNAVLPGFVVTDMVAGGKDEEQIRRTIEGVSAKAMLRRAGQPEDIANVIAFLASGESSFMTGQFLLADGGRMDYLTHA